MNIVVCGKVVLQEILRISHPHQHFGTRFHSKKDGRHILACDIGVHLLGLTITVRLLEEEPADIQQVAAQICDDKVLERSEEEVGSEIPDNLRSTQPEP
jgi:hypothetical protein